MCGLVGAAGKLQYQDEFVIKRLLFFDYLRGPDSTGLAAVRTGGEVQLCKAAMNPIEFMQLEDFKKVCNGHLSRAFIGHNRLRTKGVVNTFNAHPFQIDHITGAHNGTIDYESQKEIEKALDMKFDVDSRAIFMGFAKLGVEETIKMLTEGKESKEGAWALVWHDQEKGTLNFLRNRHRELFFCYEEGFSRMFWASEAWMLREALNASPNTYKVYGETKVVEKKKVEQKFFAFEPDVWYEYNLADLVAGSTKRPKPKARKLKGREPKQVGYSGRVDVDPFGRDKERWHQTGSGSGTTGGTVGTTNSPQRIGFGRPSTPSTTQSRGKTNTIKMVHQLIGDEIHPYAGVVNEEMFVKFGNQCVWCSRKVNYGDRGICIFEKEGRVLCRDCNDVNPLTTNPPVRIYVPGVLMDQFK